MAVIAVAVRLEEDARTCAEARIVLGAVGEGPRRPTAAETALKGAVLDTGAIAKAADDASKEIRPLPHHGFSLGYLRENIRVYLRRTLTRALERARGEPDSETPRSTP